MSYCNSIKNKYKPSVGNVSMNALGYEWMGSYINTSDNVSHYCDMYFINDDFPSLEDRESLFNKYLVKLDQARPG